MAGKSKNAGPTAHIDYRNGRPVTLHLSKVKLVVEDALGEVREYIFDQDVIAIGSDDENDLVINDSRVSRHHCRIVREHSGYMVADLGSTNGTMLNRVRIREAWMKSGTSLRLGGVEVRFQTFGERVEVMPSRRDSFGNVVGRSRRMREVFSILERIAPTAATVILEGETGSGKEVVARALHRSSPRSDAPFVVFDCSAVPKDLLESELFGHEKGSFTGAHQTRQGLFEIANGGTLFLDEIGEMSLELQPKLLRALEQREIRRVGGNRPIRVDVRLVAATNRVLEEEVGAGRFRDDLYYRLSVVRISMPPLRDRKEDIPLLARHFLRHAPFNRDQDDEPRVKGISEGALIVLMDYDWPGNVRELINVVERATSFADGDLIDVDDLSPHVLGSKYRSGLSSGDRSDPSTASIRHRKTFKEAKEEWVARFEKEYLGTLLRRHDYGISAAARDADIDRKYLRKLARKHGILPAPGSKE